MSISSAWRDIVCMTSASDSKSTRDQTQTILVTPLSRVGSGCVVTRVTQLNVTPSQKVYNLADLLSHWYAFSNPFPVSNTDALDLGLHGML